MYTTVQRYTEETTALRQEVGRWLKEQRESTGRSQRDVANMLGIEFYTWVSQIETGRGRVPPDRYESYARAMNMEPRDLVMKLLPFYDPVTARILFPDGEAPTSVPAPVLTGDGKQDAENAQLWHREAVSAHNALREAERKNAVELRRERDRAEAVEAKLRDIDFLMKEASYLAIASADGTGLRAFFRGFLGQPAQHTHSNPQLVRQGEELRKLLDSPIETPTDGGAVR